MTFSVSHPVSTLYQYHPSTNIIPRAKALGMILVSRVDTGCDTERAIYILYIFIVGYMCIFIVNWMQRAIIYTNMWLVLHKDRYNIIYNVYFKMYLSISPDHQKQNILPQNTEIRWKPSIWIFCFRSVKYTH
jgi:hypothetical protein